VSSGNKDETLKTWFHRFDFVIGLVVVLGATWWIWRHIKHLRQDRLKMTETMEAE
jgi:heme A synthase